MPTLGDVIELVHEQSYLGQNVNNVYYFLASDSAATLPALATWFETNVVVAMKIFQNDLLLHLNLRLRNLFDDGETYEEPLTGAGGVPNGAIELPSFFAGSIRLDHPTGDIRPGFKRYAGLLESSITEGLIQPGTLGQLDAVGALLVNPPSVALPNWTHVIVKRICEEPNPDPEGVPSCFKYRLPETVEEADMAFPDTFETQPQPTTQNSRKYYT